MLARLAVVLLLAIAARVGDAAAPVPTEDELERSVRAGAALFDRAAGDPAVVPEALAAFERILAEHPDQPVALVYWGCLVTMQAGGEMTLGERTDLLRRGFAAMDRAVELAPEDPVIRLVRGVNALQLPRIINRRREAAEDFHLLRRWADEEPDRLPPPLRRLALYHAGRHALRARNPDAAGILRAALAAEGDRPETAAIETMLARALQPPPERSHRP